MPLTTDFTWRIFRLWSNWVYSLCTKLYKSSYSDGWSFVGTLDEGTKTKKCSTVKSLQSEDCTLSNKIYTQNVVCLVFNVTQNYWIGVFSGLQ